MICPRFADLKERLPCSFETTFIEAKMNGVPKGKSSKALFSYLILRKAKNLDSEVSQEISYHANQTEADASSSEQDLSLSGDDTLDSQRWPRLIQPTLIRPRHAICRMCTVEGKLQEIIFTNSKHGK